MNRANHFLRCLVPCVWLAASAQAGELPPNKLTAKDSAEGWLLLFDGQTLSGWQIDGDHEIVDGALILGGKRKTRAYLPVQVVRNCEIRFQYRMAGQDSAGVGWDSRTIPGVSIPILTPQDDWHDSFLQEYFDIHHFQQRFIKHEYGANGVFAPIESLWIEVPAGSRLFLRNIRLRNEPSPLWQWILAIALVCGAVAVMFDWRRERKHPAPN